MGRLLAVLAGLLLLAACGSEGHGEPDASAEVIRLVTQTAGGGHGEKAATRLGDDAAVERYVSGFRPELADRLRAAVDAESRADGALYAQVVALGCDVPPGASVAVGDRVVITPEPVASPKQECFAPMTTVALALVPAGR